MRVFGHVKGASVKMDGYIQMLQERIRVCNSLKFEIETSWNLPPVLHMLCKHKPLLLGMHVTRCSIFRTTGFYWSFMFLLKPPILMHS